MIKKIILVRHAQTYANIYNLIAGSYDVDITEQGRMQKNKVGDRLLREKKDISVIYSSDLKRAYKTAQGIKKTFKKAKLKVDKNLREMHFGIAEGKTLDEVGDINIEWKNKWIEYGYPVNVPLQETRKEVVARAKKAIKKIVKKEKDKKVICLVTHGMLIKLLLADLLKLGDKLDGKIEVIDNTDYVELLYNTENEKLTLI